MADVLWQHSSGVFGVWQGTASGALANLGGVMGGANGNVIGSGDFNGDGRADVLMRQTNGTMVEWLGQANGQFTQFTPSAQLTDSSSRIAEIGDFNGDGQDDLLWRHSSGADAIWLASSGGNFIQGGSLPNIDLSWSVQSPDGFLF